MKPRTAPYMEYIQGLEVIGQVPLAQPTNRQYKNPSAAPMTVPAIACIIRFLI